LVQPEDLGFDSHGNLFVADFGFANAVPTGLPPSIYEFDAHGNRSTFASGIAGPRGLAFDGAGNLIVSSLTTGFQTSGTIYSLSANGQATSFASGFSNPGDLAVGVPEPSSIVLFFVGGGALLFWISARTRCAKTALASNRLDSIPC
jgi:hypothetical protein